MAIVKPFVCIRPDVKYVQKVAALPYDVYNRAEAKEVVKDNPISFLNIDRAETQFSDDVSEHDPRVYEKARELLYKMLDEGIFIEDRESAYYVYELTMNGRSQTGIVATPSIDDYQNNIIKKHEKTRLEKEIDRINHVSIVSAQTGPIFLAYRKNDIIEREIAIAKSKPAIYDFTSSDGIRHRVFKISDFISVNKIYEEFLKINDIYIADGHHRCQSAVKVGLKKREENPNYNPEADFNFFLSVLFPDAELMIMDYNRVVSDLNNLSFDEFIDKVKENFKVTLTSNTYHPEGKNTFGMFVEGKWYKLEFIGSVDQNDPVKNLDVSILQDYLLSPILGIGDPKTDKRIDFVGGIRGLGELEKRASSDMKIAFSMYPTSISELFKVADANLLMPPKSTWFEPKLRSGIFIHKI